jgi:signal transduction histidine kinase
MHFHLPNHTSFLRVHEKEHFGDNLKNFRPIITRTIQDKKHYEGYEHGKHDIDMLTFRSTFPIFHHNKLIAVLELGIDTNYIATLIEDRIKDMYDRDAKIITIIKEGTKNFNIFGDFKGKFKNYVYKENSFVKTIISKQENLHQNKNIAYDKKIYTLKWNLINFTNYSNKTIGSYLYIIDTTKDIKQNKMFFYSSLAKPIIATIIILLLISWIFAYFYKHFLALEKRTRHILDTQSSLIILTNGEELLDCNGALLKFYGYETLEAFKENYTCICDTFEEGEDLLQKFTHDEIWIQYVANNPDTIHKAAIIDKNGKRNIFNIVLDTYTLDEDIEQTYFVVTLNNISDIEKANKQLIEQSKQASLGEMIGNIAHQWRQPLSSISTITSSIALRYEHNLIDAKELNKLTDKVIENTVYLSETIDTFRNYIKEDKQRRRVILQDRIDMALSIVSLPLKDNNITLINNIDYNNKIDIVLVIGELSQVIINIMNNAKDALLETKPQNPTIEISLNIKNSRAIITIEDNGGGIPMDILPKIFEPYFTTKHQAQGTGLGLHMSYKIVTESLDGKIYAKNTDVGAKFFIELPL